MGRVTLWHEAEGCVSRAVYSRCGGYRFLLGRVWAPGPTLLWVMLNPSTATERQNDPTVARGVRRARAMGFGAVEIVNLFAFRATRPQDLLRAADPVGQGNDAVIAAAARRAGQILCGWGAHGGHQGRAARVTGLLRGRGHALWHLGLTQGGQPRHPLYLGYGVVPQPWDA